jgi:hypothetical protein
MHDDTDPCRHEEQRKVGEQRVGDRGEPIRDAAGDQQPDVRSAMPTTGPGTARPVAATNSSPASWQQRVSVR